MSEDWVAEGLDSWGEEGVISSREESVEGSWGGEVVEGSCGCSISSIVTVEEE